MKTKLEIIYNVRVGIKEEEMAGLTEGRKSEEFLVLTEDYKEAGDMAINEFKKKFKTDQTPVVLYVNLSPNLLIRKEN